ncbi:MULTISPECIES: hypothetical protein [unclassified Arthrobacter]|uniref:hypothetical protein n=1 Tax=unclassified Arthrobacter TaxID=235627 RepID=UPI00288330B5|nr:MULTISPECIES: hypothetical protein [unclassified Arthrobacter]
MFTASEHPSEIAGDSCCLTKTPEARISIGKSDSDGKQIASERIALGICPFELRGERNECVTTVMGEHVSACAFGFGDEDPQGWHFIGLGAYHYQGAGGGNFKFTGNGAQLFVRQFGCLEEFRQQSLPYGKCFVLHTLTFCDECSLSLSRVFVDGVEHNPGVANHQRCIVRCCHPGKGLPKDVVIKAYS